MTPTLEQFTALVRALLSMATGIMIGRGWITADVGSAMIALSPGLCSIVWALIRHSRVGTLLAAAQLPEVDRIEVHDSKLADATGDDPQSGAKVKNGH